LLVAITPARRKPWRSFPVKTRSPTSGLVDLGPRPAASAALEKARVYIRQNLGTGWSVEAQRFIGRHHVERSRSLT
jgi:hypothetical protein